MGVLHRDWRRRLVILSDSDQRPDVLRWAAALGLREGSQVFFIGTTGFEDEFSDETWLSVLRSHFPPQDGSGDWTAGGVQSARHASSGMGAGLTAIVSNRCRRSVGKPELGYALARTISNRGDIPQVLLRCFVAARTAAAANA